MRIYSHEGKAWHKHIQEIEERAYLCLKELSSVEKRMAQIIIRSHDIGKLTSFFQKWLHDTKLGKVKRLSPHDPRAFHTYFSALFATHWAKSEGFDEAETLLIYNVVLKHHSNLKNFTKKLPKGPVKSIRTWVHLRDALMETNIPFEDTDALLDQINDLKQNQAAVLMEFELASPGDGHILATFDEKALFDVFLYLKRGVKKREILPDERKKNDFVLHQKLYSLLLLNDRLSAANYHRPTRERNLGISELLHGVETVIGSNGKSIKTDSDLNKTRNEIFGKVLDSISDIDLKQQRIFVITSPTGSGKTITGFAAAMQIRERLEVGMGERKLVYGLPFMTIIDQCHQVICKLLNEPEEHSDVIAKYHSLVSFDNKEPDEWKQEKFFSDAWFSDIVVTTFVQIFETLSGNKKKILMRFNELRGSILILDELQSIPFRYWDYVTFLLKTLAEEMDIYIIMMTATRPQILKEEAVELLSDYADYFKRFNRTELIPLLNGRVSMERLIEENVLPVCKTDSVSVLSVFNTVRKSKEAYRKLQGVVEEGRLYYLSSHLTPVDKKKVIQKVIEALKDNTKPRPILVSTQVIEAGVDVDFDAVYREIAPLDSIIQCAGRANRNAEKDISPVTIFQLDEKADGVYEDILLEETRKQLEKYGCIPERDYLELIESYFESIHKRTSPQVSASLINHFLALNFEDENKNGLVEFRLIQNRENYVNVVVCQTEEVEQKIREMHDEVDFVKKSQINSFLKQYTVNIYRNYLDKQIQYDEEIDSYVIPFAQVGIYYDECGVKQPMT